MMLRKAIKGMSLFVILSTGFDRPTAGVTGRWAGVDSAWEQYKLEARKLPENGHESHLYSARGVGRLIQVQHCSAFKKKLRRKNLKLLNLYIKVFTAWFR